ncbi:hypothetical protein AZE74_RS09745 [Acinetobacter baumannii]|uniref:Uncharacterized protein n=1 Tax=Acinetobacter baumannii 6014059 TaxID=525242 RepID=A0A828SHT7_ACIBA|nr:hypothetical protein [Acinetobacter baumannii]EGJ67499.1 hypothetical protein HMPREF0022_02712 [Acinetobacter baumannii 6014059]EHU1546202.1 hypothetical protein [Acinetobacter baumannii]EHU1971990.1 hypothetical protein [Acinetobacter baumannii]EHU2194916.1 hypothetical protein [Acinetobacter baumannii]EHU2271461.1 hypothetical protein [Acinetobacter baumannii]
MDNYKIKVKDEAESKEAQELFFELGLTKEDFDDYKFPYYVASYNDGAFSNYILGSDTSGWEELTLPQLRDLVVLKRGDVRDATHRDKLDESIYLTSDKVIYYWYGEWCKSAINKSNDYEDYIANSLTSITQPQDPALISGADVPALIKKGESVQFRSVFNVQGGGEWQDLDLERDEEEFSLGDLINTRFEWRLKPQTIKVELELPKPFEPVEDCHVYILDDGKTDGYRRYSYEVHGDKGNTFIGIWRTEEEIKQVVEQLRKIRGTNS